MKKKMIFVSSGRCGTRRIYEILNENLPSEYKIVHQMRFSRLANVVGNIIFILGKGDEIGGFLYSYIISKYDKKQYFISTDPLTAMVIPKQYIYSKNICIVHIVRDDARFANSMYSLSRSRIKSFIAHNFVPMWQSGILPFENLLNKRILQKYETVNRKKNEYLYNKYSLSPNYVRIAMDDIFNKTQLKCLIKMFFKYSIEITDSELFLKSNSSCTI